jgi:hypothetical protein
MSKIFTKFQNIGINQNAFSITLTVYVMQVEDKEQFDLDSGK